jgi:endonuclease III related protein
MTTKEQLLRIYHTLYDTYGPQRWWPGESQFEIMIGAILTQNTSWTNVEKAIANLRSADALSPERLHAMAPEELAQLIRPAGYYKLKTKRLKNFLDWLMTQSDGNLERVSQWPLSSLREALLSISGIGPETADSILLYAFTKPVFVVDTYTARLAVRHGLIEQPFDYHQLQDLFQSNLPEDIQLYNEYHALIVQIGKHFCKPKAKCDACPLNALPHTLDIEG